MQPPLKPDVILRERYQLLEIVGQGGMGCIYKAADLRLPGRFCALKEILLDDGLSADDRQQLHDQFLTEASILAQLDHPNLPKVSDFFTENEREYLVMDFVPGQDLKQAIDASIQEGELLDYGQVLDWADQIMDTLIYLHEQPEPVVHRDIKPANIKLTPDGRIKVVDFGLVKLLASDEERTMTVMQGRGSAVYTPLEQYGGDGGSTDVRSDVYSFGATMYHLLTSKVPPDAKARFLNPHSLKAPDDLNPVTTDFVADAVLWAMEMHPDDRPSNVRQLRDVIDGVGEKPEKVVKQQDDQVSAESLILDALAANQIHFFILFILALIALLITII